jgi:hypothetical protein
MRRTGWPLPVFVLAVLTVLVLAVPALAALVDPRPPEPGELRDNHYFADCPLVYQYKFDDLKAGEAATLTQTIAGKTITVVIYLNDAGKTEFDFTSQLLIKKVQVKGGPDNYIYDYTGQTGGGVYGDTGLRAADNRGENQADLSNIVFCFDPGTTDPGRIEGSKWYDRNKDGVWDKPAEPGITGWKISLYKWNDAAEAYEWLSDTMTGLNGAYKFDNLGPGLYKVAEANPSGNWVQTYPAAPGYYADIRIIGNNVVSNRDFGNVCVRYATGYTMGFWSNKNGTAILNANTDTLLAKTGYPSVSAIQDLFRSSANATDMNVMLEAQYVAHLLNVAYKGADYSGTGVLIGGVLYKYDDVMADFAALGRKTASRSTLEWYKDFFDGLNNNWFDLVNWGPCTLPVWTS